MCDMCVCVYTGLSNELPHLLLSGDERVLMLSDNCELLYNLNQLNV